MVNDLCSYDNCFWAADGSNCGTNQDFYGIISCASRDSASTWSLTAYESYYGVPECSTANYEWSTSGTGSGCHTFSTPSCNVVYLSVDCGYVVTTGVPSASPTTASPTVFVNTTTNGSGSSNSDGGVVAYALITVVVILVLGGAVGFCLYRTCCEKSGSKPTVKNAAPQDGNMVMNPLGPPLPPS